MLPSTEGAMGWPARPARDSRTLPKLFREAGFRTGLFSNSIMLRDPGFLDGFDAVRFVGRGQMVSQQGVALTKAALGFVKQTGERPFFLYLHYLDPHGPYDPPARFRERFPETSQDPRLLLYGDVRDRCSELVASGFGPGEARFEDLRTRYDAEVAYTDHAIRLLLAGLESAGLGERTLVVVTADHGEEFLEHDYVEHAWTLYDESLHVPLILWAPAFLGPERVGAPVSLVDVVPTLATLFGLEAETAQDGAPLLARSWRGWRFEAPERPVFAELLIQSRNVVRSVTWDGWKYISAKRWLTPAEREARVREGRIATLPADESPVDAFGVGVREELYHLASDPEERNDRASDEPERLATMREVMRSFEQSPRRTGAAPDPGSPLSDEEREALRALGYIQ